MPKECVCGVMGSETIPEVKQVINYKRDVKGERYWTYVKCPLSDTYHAYNGDFFTEEEYLKDLLDGKHKSRIENSKLRHGIKPKSETIASSPAKVLTIIPERETMNTVPAGKPYTGSVLAPGIAPVQSVINNNHCSKLAYPDEPTANMALRVCIAKGRGERSCYECGKCHLWHLTSQEASTTRYETVAKWAIKNGHNRLVERAYIKVADKPEEFHGIAITKEIPGDAPHRAFINKDEFSQLLAAIVEATLDEEEPAQPEPTA